MPQGNMANGVVADADAIETGDPAAPAPIATVDNDRGIIEDSLGPRHVAQERFDNFLSVILYALSKIGRRFLTMGTRDRVWLSLAAITLVGGAMLWPILLCLRLDGLVDIPYKVIWIPLWVYDVLGVMFFVTLIRWGKIQAPPGMEDGWKDPYPVSLRTMELCKWLLIILFQVFLVLRLDGHIDWLWLKVMSPLLAWACLRMFGYLYKVHVKSSWLGVQPSVEAVPAVLGSCIVLLQLVLIILKLDDEVDWSWWFVFLPVWLVYCFTFCCSCLSNFAFSGIADADNPDAQSAEIQNRRNAAMAAVQFQRTTHPLSGIWIVTAVLAVAAISGANFSTFIIFVPQFIASGLLLCVLLCCICSCRVNIPGVFQAARGDQ